MLWHTGEITWVRDEKPPTHLQTPKSLTLNKQVSLGQPIQVLRFNESNNNEKKDNIKISQLAKNNTGYN